MSPSESRVADRLTPADMPEVVKARPQQPRDAWVRFGIAVAVVVLACFGPVIALIQLALATDLHSHVLLVPWVAGYLVWIERHRLPLAGTPAVAATVLLGVAAAGCFAAGMGSVFTLPADERLSLQILGLVLSIGACGTGLLGMRVVRACAFSFSFLLFMVPLPEVAVDLCETVLQHSSAEVSYWAIDLTGIPVMRDGLVFRLPGISIRVAQECSGFRSTLVLFIVSLVAAKMFLRTPWKQAVLVLAIFPLGVARNAFRIWTLVTLSVQVDPAILNSWLHHRGGPIFFALSLIPLYFLLWSLYRSERGSVQVPVGGAASSKK